MTPLSKIEALLFVAGEDGLSLRQLATLLDIPVTALLQQLEKMAQKYEGDDNSALSLLESSKTYKLVTKKDYADLYGSILKRRLIRAYQEPVWKFSLS